jgi:hypothetical protein
MNIGKKNRPPNYRKLFYMGILCVGMGVPLGSPILIGLGTVLMIMGWANKHRWPPRAWMSDKDWQVEMERMKKELEKEKGRRPSKPGDSI